MTEKRRIILNIVVTYGRSLYALVLGLFCGRWALMALGEVDFGLYGLIGGLIVFMTFFNGILASANARFYAYSVGAAGVADDKIQAIEECRHWFNTALSVHIVIPMLVMAVGYPVGVHAVHNWLTIPLDRVDACVWVFRYVCISSFVSMVNVPFSAMYTAKQYIAELTIYSFLTTTAHFIILYYMVTHPGVWLTKYAFWTCLTAVVPQIIICCRALYVFPECHIKVSYMWEKERVKRIAMFGFWQAFGNLCGILRVQGMSIVINKLFGAAMNAAQSLGNSVQGQCVSLAAAMQGAFTPVITQACGAGDYKKMNEYVIRTCKFNMMLSLIFILPLSLELPMIMKLWLKTPPDFAVGLCYCALALYLIKACTVGHMIAVNAKGSISGYYSVLSGINIFTVPIAVAVGLVWMNVYLMMGAVIFMEILNSIGRIYFARRETDTSVRAWMKSVLMPVSLVVFICGVVGAIPRVLMESTLVRLGVTTIICEFVFFPLAWCVVLSSGEKQFLIDKIRLRLNKLRCV